MARPKSKSPRSRMISVRLTEAEASYLQLAASSEPMGPTPMATYLRGLGMARTQQLTGVGFPDFVAAESKPTKKART